MSTSQLDFFDTVHRAYIQAEDRSPSVLDRYYAIGPYTVRLRFAGPALVPYATKALAHLATAAAPHPALTVCIWDSASTRTVMPLPPRPLAIYGVGGELAGFARGRIQAVVQLGPSIVNLLDTRRNLAIHWVRSAGQIPPDEFAAPLRVILQRWAASRGIQFVHAGAVGLPGGGVLLPGKSGSGKSNTALCSLLSELLYASDDYCLVEGGLSPTAFSLYSTGKCHPNDLNRLPFLRSMIGDPANLAAEKALYFLHDHVPEKLTAGFPLRAILAPQVTGLAETTLTSISPTEAMAALAPSTTILAPSDAARTFRALAQVVRQVPAYRLHVGTCPEQTASAILSLLRQAPLSSGDI